MIAQIVSREQVSRDHYRIGFSVPGIFSEPGQFINIRAGESTDPLLRRPISVFNHEKDILEIIIRVIGPGTALIAREGNRTLDIVPSLGKGFSLMPQGKVLMVGGGVGNAPLYFLSRILAERGVGVDYIYGSASAEFIFCDSLYAQVAGSLHFTTDDGTRGERGFPTMVMKRLLAENTYEQIYTCGPLPMMRAVSAGAGTVPVEVSFENYFACGVGLCSGCTVETINGYSRACVDGPVYRADVIDWERLQ